MLQCRQLVSVCDEILNSSPDGLLTRTAQLERVDLVPVSPGDQLVRPTYSLELFVVKCTTKESYIIVSAFGPISRNV